MNPKPDMSSELRCQHCKQPFILYRWHENGVFDGTPYCERCRHVFVGAIVDGGTMDVEVAVTI